MLYFTLLVLALAGPTDGDSNQQLRCHVSAGMRTAALQRLLLQELPNCTPVKNPEQADLLVRLRADSRRLFLEVYDGSQTVLVEREVSLEHGEKPALRAVVVVVSRAASSPALRRSPLQLQESQDDTAESAPLAAQVSESSLHQIHFSSAAYVNSWNQPIAPQPGVFLSCGWSTRGWTLGAAASVTGAFCCPLSTSGIDAELAESTLFLQGKVPLVQLPWMLLQAFAGGGVVFTWLRLRPTVYAGEALQQEHFLPQGLALLGVSYRLFFLESRLLAELNAGIQLRLYSHFFRLPAAYTGGGPDIISGNIMPFASLGVGYRLFQIK